MLIPRILMARLIQNGEAHRADPRMDPRPVVKLFTPDGAATWLLSEVDPDQTDLAFGLCDLGHGAPELGYVSLAELASVRGPLGLPVEHDRFFEPEMTVGAYARRAIARGAIRD